MYPAILATLLLTLIVTATAHAGVPVVQKGPAGGCGAAVPEVPDAALVHATVGESFVIETPSQESVTFSRLRQPIDLNVLEFRGSNYVRERAVDTWTFYARCAGATVLYFDTRWVHPRTPPPAERYPYRAYVVVVE